MIFTLSATLQPAQVHTQTLEATTVHQLVTVMDPPSLSHSWRVVTTFSLTKLKSSMKPPEGMRSLESNAYTSCTMKVNLQIH